MLRTFTKYFKSKKAQTKLSQKSEDFSSSDLVYVKKWRKCKQGVVFCLSNRIV